MCSVGSLTIGGGDVTIGDEVSATNILDTILAHKRDTEVPARKRAISERAMRDLAERYSRPTRDFAAALQRADGTVALIAEVKRASPSRGIFVPGAFDPVAIARLYEDNGASAISVLTDEKFFAGSLDYMTAISAQAGVPVLRKDFVVDPYQIYEARQAGADAVLLIVAALNDDELRDLYQLATAQTLTALIEVHDVAETERALKLGARVIGVNNRDLQTFETSLQTTAHCADAITGNGHVLVSESGIHTQKHVEQVAAMGANAILVGESIIVSDDRAGQVRALSGIAKTYT